MRSDQTRPRDKQLWGRKGGCPWDTSAQVKGGGSGEEGACAGMLRGKVGTEVMGREREGPSGHCTQLTARGKGWPRAV